MRPRTRAVVADMRRRRHAKKCGPLTHARAHARAIRRSMLRRRFVEIQVGTTFGFEKGLEPGHYVRVGDDHFRLVAVGPNTLTLAKLNYGARLLWEEPSRALIMPRALASS